MSNPYSKGKADPFNEESAIQVISCPKCKSQEFDARQNQWHTWRICRDCGTEWSGGIGVARPDYSEPPSAVGIPAPDDDRPVSQYTGAAFRDPSKNVGGDE